MDTAASSANSPGSASTMLFCHVCQAVYRQPKLLPCLHSFCRPCLVDAVTHGEDGTVIECPLCVYKAKMPASGIVGIPDNCFLNRMCQAYVNEVQCHLVARSHHGGSSKQPSEFSALRSKLSQELSHPKYIPSPGTRPCHGSQNDAQAAQEIPLPDTTAGNWDSMCEQSTAITLEAIRNRSRLQSKIMSLQGEALRVTYAIDQVNQSMVEWHQHKEDVKRAVQRRSAQFQFFIKRLEHQLISQIDGKHVDDEFYAESDHSKAELRKILKNILHEVSILKSVQELGKDLEVNILSPNLLGKSVGMTDVLLKRFHYSMEVPTQAMEEIVAEFFGEVRLVPEEINVFAPEIIDFTEIPVGSVGEPSDEDEIYFYYDEDEVLSAEGEATSSSVRSSAGRRPRQYDTDKHVTDHLLMFHNARETLRTRRREILARGQQARGDTSPLRDETLRQHKPSLKKGRVQSLDRVAIPMRSKGKMNIPKMPTVDSGSNGRSPETSKMLSKPEGIFTPVVSTHYRIGVSHSLHGLIPENMTFPSPVVEEVSLPSSPQMRLVKQSSDPHAIHNSLSTSEEGLSYEVLPHGHPHFDLEQQRGRRYSNPTSGVAWRGRRHSSEHYTLPSSSESTALAMGQDKCSSRPARRAISIAADKKTKMEFLRENWQKRKEILIQSAGFVSPDIAAKPTSRSFMHAQHYPLSEIPSHIADPPVDSEPWEHAESAESISNGIPTTERTMYQTDSQSDIVKSGEDLQTASSGSIDSHQQMDLSEHPYDVKLVTKERINTRLETTLHSPLQMESNGSTYSCTLTSEVSSNGSSTINLASCPSGLTTSASADEPPGGSRITRVPTKKASSLLRITQERLPAADSRVCLEPSASIQPRSVSPSPSSLFRAQSSLSPTDGDQKVRLREIARKKRERWRHLTIH